MLDQIPLRNPAGKSLNFRNTKKSICSTHTIWKGFSILLCISKIQALSSGISQRYLIKYFMVLFLTEAILPYPKSENLLDKDHFSQGSNNVHA